MDKSFINNLVTWSLIGIVLLLTFIILKPIGIAILVGMLLGYIFKPVERKIRKLVRNKTVSVLIMIILLLALIIIPIISFSPTIVKQLYDIYGELKRIDISSLITSIIPSLKGDEILYHLTVFFNNFIDKLIVQIMNFVTNIITNIANVLLQIFVVFFTFFFVVRDYESFLKSISKLSPFKKDVESKLAKEFTSVTNAVLMGQALVGIIQGVLMGLGFLILGFNNVLLLTILSMIFGIIPIIGPWLVWIPVALFTFLEGNTTIALLLAGYGFIFISNIDNLIRPYLVSRSSNLPTAISLIGTVGGLLAFGVMGLIIGPLILAYALIVLEFYEKGSYTTITSRGEKNEVKNKKI